MINAKGWEISAKGMKCPCKVSWWCNCLMYGEWIYGAFSSFIWKYIHTPSCGLCIKMGEAAACPKNDANTVVGFLQRNILYRFGTPRTIISDGGSYFTNKVFDKLMGSMVSNTL